MPLPLKSLREASLELGISEAELRTMVDLKKVRALLKKGAMLFAPDELAKIRRLRKTMPESTIKAPPPVVAAPPKAAPPRRPPPPRRRVP